MAVVNTPEVQIRGIAACVPEKREANRPLALFADVSAAERFIASTGVESRHIVGDSGICASDLCSRAADELLTALGWEKQTIDCLIFVSQTPDFLTPATSCLLQKRLSLPSSCYALDISLGCSGWVYGLSVMGALLGGGTMRRGLLLAGETPSVTKSPRDRSTYPLFGDAGTATAVEFVPNDQGMHFVFGTDGEGAEAIMIRDGGRRHPFSPESLEYHEIEAGIIRNNLQLSLDGAAVFAFALRRVPECVQNLLEHVGVDLAAIDYCVLHQANHFLNDKLRRKLGLPERKVPSSLREFGNTSSASVPLTMVTNIADELDGAPRLVLASGFGVGLSWGAVLLRTNAVVCPPLLRL